jgi:hypothetical protein
MSRDDIEQYFTSENLKSGCASYLSPSEQYLLTVRRYITKPGYGDYSKGVVTHAQTNDVLTEVKRNYGDFWHCFVSHPNGHEYLLCGEDYQGYSVIELDTGERRDYLPTEAAHGVGFCWIECEADDDDLELRVEGCYWACPYEVVRYRFDRPLELPYEELSREDLNPIDDESEEEENDSDAAV